MFLYTLRLSCISEHLGGPAWPLQGQIRFSVMIAETETLTTLCKAVICLSATHFRGFFTSELGTFFLQWLCRVMWCDWPVGSGSAWSSGGGTRWARTPWDYSDCPATGIIWHTEHEREKTIWSNCVMNYISRLWCFIILHLKCLMISYCMSWGRWEPHLNPPKKLFLHTNL